LGAETPLKDVSFAVAEVKQQKQGIEIAGPNAGAKKDVVSAKFKSAPPVSSK